MVYDGVIQGRGHPETKCGRAVGSHTTLRAVGQGITGVYPRAVGSHANLSAVGQGALGDSVPQKIEMFCGGMVECSDKTKTHRNNDINISKQLLDRDCTARDASVTTQDPRTRRRRKMEPTQVWSLSHLQNRTGRQVRIHIQLHPQQRERHHDVL